MRNLLCSVFYGPDSVQKMYLKRLDNERTRILQRAYNQIKKQILSNGKFQNVRRVKLLNWNSMKWLIWKIKMTHTKRPPEITKQSSNIPGFWLNVYLNMNSVFKLHTTYKLSNSALNRCTCSDVSYTKLCFLVTICRRGSCNVSTYINILTAIQLRIKLYLYSYNNY